MQEEEHVVDPIPEDLAAPRSDARTSRELTTPARRRSWWWIAVPLAIALLAAARWLWPDASEVGAHEDRGPTPVEVAPIVQGAIDEARVFTATLEPSAQVVVAAEVAGTVRSISADLADSVEADEPLAQIDDREHRQRQAAARAQLSVAQARAHAAESSVQITARALTRTRTLNERGIASERELDGAIAASLEAEAASEIADAEVAQARATLAAARLELAHTEIRGRWTEETGPRRVAARHVDEGARVQVGDPLFTLVDVDPLIIVVMASAGDYARLAPGQEVTLEGDPDHVGRIARVAPGFDPETRQARVEIEIANPDGDLQPGMFVRAHAVLDRAEDATLVPRSALAQRGGKDVVFVLAEGADTVRMVEVETGLQTGEIVQVRGESLAGRVVTLGHQRLTDGAAVSVTEP